MLRATALVLTVLTGFSGLVYEVAWQKYLATLLGSHSEATAAVLGIFLGGLSVGYSLFGTVTRRLVEAAERSGSAPRLLLVYGGLELGIGLWVLAFPWLFRGVQSLSYAIPHGPTGVGFAVDVALCALLIAPPSVLMGGTIPMLTQALSKSLEDATRFHAFVYAFNTFGAFVGALAAGFYLIPRIGLETAMVSMGFINVGAGLLFGVLGVRGRNVVSLVQPEGPESTSPASWSALRPYAVVALLTGFAMMCLQTVLIRVGVIAFGSSAFTFSLVVAVFVLAIALGSFAVSAMGSISKHLVVANQWAIAVLFTALYLRLEESPYWVHLVRTLFRDSETGFVGFQAASVLFVLSVIGFPVLLSGASLPLLFHQTRRSVGHLGDLAGSLYSWNTVGSLLGALLGGYALLFWLDLDEVYLVAVASLVAAALALSVRVYALKPIAWSAAAPLALALALLPAWDAEILHAGLSRMRQPGPGLLDGAKDYLEARGAEAASWDLLFHEDDPTTSVVVWETHTPTGVPIRALYTDGKGDGDTFVDYKTSALLGLMPALFAERAERAFVAGRGAGITAGTLASIDSMERVHLSEISPAVVEAAHLFDFASHESSKHPKIETTRSDAFRALMRSDEEFDVIVAAPSQLWVAGVEMLYSREFLEAARDRLREGGVYCQYLQRYETDETSLRLAMRTMSEVFEHTAVWDTGVSVLLVLGFQDERPTLDTFRLEARASQPDFRQALQRAGIEGFPALLAHELIPAGVLDAALGEGPVHSLYHPRLNDVASRAAFRGETGELPFTGFGEARELGMKNSLVRRYLARFSRALLDEARAEIIRAACEQRTHICSALLAEWVHDGSSPPTAEQLVAGMPLRAKREELLERARTLVPLFGASAQSEIGPREARLRGEGYVRYYAHAAPFSPEALLGSWSACRALAPPAGCTWGGGARGLFASTDGGECSVEGIGEACTEGLRHAKALVEQGVKPPKRRGTPRP